MNRTNLIIIVVMAVMVTGCSTTQQASPTSQLQIKVAQLERQIKDRDQEIEELRYEVKDLASQLENQNNFMMNEPVEEYKKPSVATSPKSGAGDEDIIRVSASVQEVQRALKAAGYYKGTIDGKLGQMSKDAIKKFQTDNDLKADGIVGRRTWAMLKDFE